MVDNSSDMLKIVWIITEIFFIVSFIFLIILFIVHKIIYKRNLYFKNKEDKYASLDLEIEVKLSNEIEIIAYSHIIGLKLLNIRDKEKRKKIKDIIKKLNLYDKIFNIYTKKSTTQTRLYIFSILALLTEHKGRTFYIHMLDKKNKNNKDMIEFIRWIILALSISSKTHKDLEQLYKILQKLNNELFFTQKLYQFFLVESFYVIEDNELITFLNNFRPKEINHITTSVIYSLQSQKYSKDLYDSLMNIYQLYKKDTQMLVSILRTLDIWQCQEEDIIFKYHNSTNDLIRIVCAKVGLNMINESKFYILYHYLFDTNPYVRKNFLVALSKYQIPYYEIMYDIKKNYPQYITNDILRNSILQYKAGVL